MIPLKSKLRAKEFFHSVGQAALGWTGLFCFFGFAFLIFYLRSGQSFYWDIYTSRDILRALGWLDGRFYYPGPEMSSGNNLPGPFFYFLLFPPLLFGGDIYSHSALWFVSWLALTYAAAFHFVSKITKHKESLLIFLFVFIGFMRGGLFNPFILGWNAGFAVLFHIFALMSLYFWREKGEDRYLYLAGIIIALGVQTHLLLLTHIFSAILFFVLDFFRSDSFGKAYKKKHIGKKLKPIFLFALLSCLPFLIYSLLEIFQVFEVSRGHYVKFPRYLIESVFHEKWLSNVKKMFPASCSLLLVFFCLILPLRRKGEERKRLIQKSTWNLLILFLPLLIVMILGARIVWYTYSAPALLTLLVSKWSDDLAPAAPEKRLSFALACGALAISPIFLSGGLPEIFSLSNFFLIAGGAAGILLIALAAVLAFLLLEAGFLKKAAPVKFLKPAGISLILCFSIHAHTIKYLPEEKPRIQESFNPRINFYQPYMRPLMKRIFLETNWEPKTAMRRIYSIGLHHEESLLAHYAIAGEKAKAAAKQPSAPSPSGYFIVQHLKRFAGHSAENWKEYLSASPALPDFLHKEIAAEKILIQPPSLYGSYWLIPYQIAESSVFTEGFHNAGQPYYWEEPEWLKNCGAVRQFQTEEGFFYCMVLPGALARAGVYIKLSDAEAAPHKSGGAVLDIAFFGPLIGLADNSANRDGYALWHDIQLEVLCGRKRFRYALPDTGLHYTHKLPYLLTPLALRFPSRKGEGLSGCAKEDIGEIEMTFSHLFEEPFVRFWPPEKKKIVWKNRRAAPD